MKLNYKSTVLVGFAFFSITLFWQVYDSMIPKVLENIFNFNNTERGLVMAADNVVALFMLPLFGHLSDKTKTRWGRRTPYIVCGTVLSAATIVAVGVCADYAMLVPFIVCLGFNLVFMSTYRSPAVSLMPDITVKPLRSKANAIINLMGAVGGIIALGLMSVLVKESVSSYIYSFIAAAVIMMLALVLFIVFVREKKLVERREEDEIKLGLEDDNRGEMNTVGRKLTKAERKSMIFLLLSVVFWFMGYNAVTSSFSVYAEVVWKIEGGGFSIPMMVASAAAIIAYVPVGILANKIGRKKTI